MEFLGLKDFPCDTCILLWPEVRRQLFDGLHKKFGSLILAGKRLGICGSDLYAWKNGFSYKRGVKRAIKRYIPLPALKKICLETGISLEILQSCVSEIKVSSRSGIIRNPILPLHITPETYAVLGHFLGDGYGGEKGNACYVNKSEEALENFLSKIRVAFGDLRCNLMLRHFRVIVPKIVPKILKQYFEIPDFRTGKARLSDKLLNAPNDCLIEFLKALIIDEGRVSDNGIDLEFSPKALLVPDLKKICSKLGYSYYDKKHFIISGKSFQRIIHDMDDLVIPHKQQMLLKYFKRKERGWYNRKKGDTRDKIVRLLSKRPMTTKEIAMNLNMKQESVRSHLKGYVLNNKHTIGLLEMGAVEVKSLGWRNAAIFGLKSAK